VHVGKVRRTHGFSCCLSSFSGIDPSSISYFLGVSVSCPCPEIELSMVEHEAVDCRLDEWREMGTVEEGMSLISRDL